MRPLFHPSLEEVTVEGILHALADSTRVAIFTDISMQDCSQNCSTFVRVGERDIPKSTLSLHFKVLREAGLIRSERRGVEMLNFSRCQEIEGRFPNLLASIITAHQIQLVSRAKAAKAAAKKSAKRSTADL